MPRSPAIALPAPDIPSTRRTVTAMHFALFCLLTIVTAIATPLGLWQLATGRFATAVLSLYFAAIAALGAAVLFFAAS